MYYLGIDWGMNRLGLAIADSELGIATVLEDVPTSESINKIRELKKEYIFDKFIFGGLALESKFYEKKIENISSGDDIRNIKNKYLKELKGLEIDVVIAEEMLSTKMAQRNLLESGKKRVSKKDNGEAAKIILQGWLDGCLV